MPTHNPTVAQSANDTSDVKAVVAQLSESWNRHDMTAFAALFTENADFINVDRDALAGAARDRGKARADASHDLPQ